MSDRAARTAFGPMTVVAMEQNRPAGRRLVADDLACRMLPPGSRFVVRLTRWAPIERLVLLASEKKAPGIWGSVLCRKRYIDDKVVEAVREGVDAVVILGAGLDTRAYRLPGLAGTPVFEADLPESVEYKAARLREVYGRVPDPVTLVPVDFESQDLAGVLASKGWDAAQRTLFVWEAVTQYLTEEGVRKTFGFLAEANAGSRLVFTYVRKDFVDGDALYGLDALYQDFRVKEQLWRFGMAPERVAGFIGEYGWRELEQAGTQEFAARYLTPSGRELPVSEVERSVWAQKT